MNFNLELLLVCKSDKDPLAYQIFIGIKASSWQVQIWSIEVRNNYRNPCLTIFLVLNNIPDSKNYPYV